jgi:hypothetical protein
MIQAVTARSLKYFRELGTPKLGQAATFHRTVLPLSSGSHLVNGLTSLVYMCIVLLGVCNGCVCQMKGIQRCADAY